MHGDEDLGHFPVDLRPMDKGCRTESEGIWSTEMEEHSGCVERDGGRTAAAAWALVWALLGLGLRPAEPETSVIRARAYFPSLG